MGIITLVTVSIVGAGCSSNGLPEYTKLGGLRVLTLISEPPEVSPGATVAITPLLSDIAGLGRALTYTALACADPGVGYGARASCATSTSKVELAQGTLNLAAPNYTGAGTTFNVTVPNDVLQRYSAQTQAVGIPYLVTYEIGAADGSRVQAFKRIIVSPSTKSTKNQNPSTPSILASGVTLSTLPSQKSEMTVSLAGTVDATLTTTWFLSDGTFQRYRTSGSDSLSYTPPSELPKDHSVVITIVVRDKYGGASYKIYGL
jgi:RNase H-fold protein (predicted Holliday junction resolvase)